MLPSPAAALVAASNQLPAAACVCMSHQEPGLCRLLVTSLLICEAPAAAMLNGQDSYGLTPAIRVYILCMLCKCAALVAAAAPGSTLPMMEEVLIAEVSLCMLVLPLENGYKPVPEKNKKISKR
jgi:hypothetical protein